MIDAILRGLLVGGGAYAGAKLGEKYLSGGATETPIWTGHIGGDIAKPALSMTMVRYRGRMHYRLYVVSEGQWALAASAWEYPEVLAAIQTWERYIAEGGTVAAWQARNTLRANEVAELEQSWR